jgi:hypothetical protein
MVKFILSAILSFSFLGQYALATSYSADDLQPVDEAQAEGTELLKGIKILWTYGELAYYSAIFALEPCDRATEECGWFEKKIDYIAESATAMATAGIAVSSYAVAKKAYANLLTGFFKKRMTRIGAVIGGAGATLWVGGSAGNTIDKLIALSRAEKEQILDNLKSELSELQASTSVAGLESAKRQFPELARVANSFK